MICKYCNKYYIGRREKQFCSRTCANKWRVKKEEILIDGVSGRICRKCKLWIPLSKMCAKGSSKFCMSCKRQDPRQKYSVLKSKAKNYRNLSFTITFEEFKKISQNDCFYCGVPSTGFDRIDSNQGYEPHNIIACCQICNFGKSNMSHDKFIIQCDKIFNHMCKSS